MSNIISIISDWQNDDYYLGIIKAKITASCPDTRIIDISNNVPHHSTMFAGFLLKSIYTDFPKNTIHIIAVKSCESSQEKAIILKFNEQFFICNNNGVLSSVLDNNETKYEAFEIFHEYAKSTFPEKDIFANAAIKIIQGTDINKIGEKIEEIKLFQISEPIINKEQILGNILYFDSFGNAITNITKEIFYKNVKGNFNISVDHPDVTIVEISQNYSEKRRGDLIALFNSLGLLEICLHTDNLEKKFSLDNNSKIIIEFTRELTLF